MVERTSGVKRTRRKLDDHVLNQAVEGMTWSGQYKVCWLIIDPSRSSIFCKSTYNAIQMHHYHNREYCFSCCSRIMGPLSTLLGSLDNLQVPFLIHLENWSRISVSFGVRFIRSSYLLESGDKEMWIVFVYVSDIGDGQLEVVGLENTLFVSQIIVGVRAHGLRLAQCSSIVIR